MKKMIIFADDEGYAFYDIAKKATLMITNDPEGYRGKKLNILKDSEYNVILLFDGVVMGHIPDTIFSETAY